MLLSPRGRPSSSGVVRAPPVPVQRWLATGPVSASQPFVRRLALNARTRPAGGCSCPARAASRRGNRGRSGRGVRCCSAAPGPRADRRVQLVRGEGRDVSS